MPRLPAIVLLALLAFAGTTGVATAQDDVTWAVRTADNEFGSARDNYGYVLDPGGQLEDGLVVVNNGTTPLDLSVYAADAFTTTAGGLDLRTRDTKPTGVGAWVHPGQDHVTVQAGQSIEVPFTLSVPEDAAAGDHMGGIVTALKQDDVERRVGVRIQLRVGGDLKPALSVENMDVRYASTGDATVTYAIHNTGNAILATKQTVSIAGPFGTWRVPPVRVDDSPPLLPGESWQMSVPVHDVTAAFVLTGTVSLTPLLTDASGSTVPLPTADTTAHSSAVPWMLLGVVVVVLCGLVFVLRTRRRRRGTQATPLDDARSDLVATGPAD
jgi:Bacterial protein of unknown function (DUF916)